MGALDDSCCLFLAALPLLVPVLLLNGRNWLTSSSQMDTNASWIEPIMTFMSCSMVESACISTAPPVSFGRGHMMLSWHSIAASYDHTRTASGEQQKRNLPLYGSAIVWHIVVV